MSCHLGAENPSQRLIPKADGKGRCAAIEILLNTPLVADLIFKDKVHALKKSGEAGMQTFDQALFYLYEGSEISYEDALRNADSINEVKLNIKLNSKRARAENAAPKVELSMQEEKKEEGAKTPGGTSVA